MKLESLCKKAGEIVLETGKFIRQQSQRIHEITIEEKDANNLVSIVDRQAEAQLVDTLGKLLPGAGFLTEEDTPNVEGKPWEWIIDPLDGTTNFLYGVPCFSVSVGLRREEQLVAGVIYEINQDELFFAWEKGKAFLNNKIIHVSKRKILRESLLATGFPFRDFAHLDKYLNTFGYLMRHTRGIRRLGSAAVDMAYVACGRYDGFFEYSLNPWDVAAGAVIVKEAGGMVCDFSGGNDYLFGRKIIAANPDIMKALLEVLQEEFR
ncbi:MAG TPA: inositol monophosphatase family protein [Chitinophagales bacterium]|nr:inositol monophosphatase family protein [Chitinophagales bacterium]